MKTIVVCFPFDLFGSGGAGAGTNLLADELREVLADNKRERVPTRARAYTEHVKVREVTFERIDDYTRWRETGRQLARAALERGDFLVWLTGNHLGALPVYDELSALGEQALVVQLDAHLDVHHFQECSREPTHGNFLLHVAGPLPPLLNVGHRELLLPAEHVARSYRRAFSAVDLAAAPEEVLAEVQQTAAAAGRVFLDLDCDVFDPAFFPAVSRPVPFGLGPEQVLRVLEAAWAGRVAGVFISEFDPGRDQNDRSLGALVWLLELLLLRRYE
jgi:arginase family enzyme